MRLGVIFAVREEYMRRAFLILCIAAGLCGCGLPDGGTGTSDNPFSLSADISSSADSENGLTSDSSNPLAENVCVMSIECSSVFKADVSERGMEEFLPPDGVIFAAASVEFSEGETVFDLLKRVCAENRIHMEASWTPVYNSAYIEGINNLYEFDFGSGSGWTYSVNGVLYNRGSSGYVLKNGDIVEWRYTCDLGRDIGGEIVR